MPKLADKKLLIVESPAKAKTIGKYLGNGYRVLASVGHIRDLPKSNKNAIDIEAGFVPNYEIVKGKELIVDELKNAAKKSSNVFLATDPDREGEAIAWHIAEAINLGDSKIKRIVFHEITKEAVETAIAQPREIDKNLLHAQEARRVLDRLFGYDLSGLIWQKLRYGLSAGRVQSPALRILVEREKEIRAFVPVRYWVITAVLKTKNGDDLTFTAAVEPKTEQEAETIVAAGRKAKWRIGGVEARSVARRPRPPFTTSTLQQAASSRLGFSPAVTMRHAQRLYEAGLITYMRTDSTAMNAGVLHDIIALARAVYGETYASTPRFYQTKSKNAQEAHEAIRPTKIGTRAGDLPAGRQGGSDGERKLYDLIWRRALACQMADAEGAQTTITAVADNPSVPAFTASGYLIKFDGWWRADPAARGEENELPAVKKDEPLDLKNIASEGKETTPPNRYSEAGLVKELEKRGLGRPSTYASIIKTILDRGYVEKLNRSLQPTETGEVVSDFLTANFYDYISDSFTAKMEDELDEIAGGRLEYIKLLKHFYEPFHQAVLDKKKIPKISNLGAGPAELKCPNCGGEMVWKLGRSGKFLSCARFPDCSGTRSASGEAMMGPKETGEKCPECQDGKLIERDGRFGRFVACANYPKCKFVKPDEQAAAAADTGVKCPVCGKGTMAARRGRYGIFYGCTNYPVCKNATKAKPTGDRCPQCGALMMAGTKTIPVRCSNKACPNHHPQKLKP